MKRIILVNFFIFIFSVLISAQKIQWNNSPQKGFVYQISNDEAEDLLTNKIHDSVYKDLLHTLVDSFSVEQGWVNQPEKGHFIMASVVQNKLECKYVSVFPYQVFLFEEYGAFSLQVLDKEGNVREDAKVRLNKKRIRVDPESKTYRLENMWFYGSHKTATVELENFRSIFNIKKHIVTKWFNDNGNYNAPPKFYSYLITDKNKYKPGDKVRFKSYALNNFRYPLRKQLEVWLYDYYNQKQIKVGLVEPHRPGSFADEFMLHDSLKLVLDKSYSLQIREKEGRIVASCNFRYEDYELVGNKLEVSISSTNQYFPEKNQVSIVATDINGLMLKDARATILVKPIHIKESFQQLVIIPDTLLFKRLKLDPASPTLIDIPAELFQKTNTSYRIEVVVLNSENKRLTQNYTVNFYYSNYQITSCLSGDSICFDYLINGKPAQNIPVKMRVNNEIDGTTIILPYKEKINPAIKCYSLDNEHAIKQISLVNLTPTLEISGGIQKDSFLIELTNPQNIDVTWHIYQGSQLLEKGNGNSLEHKSQISNRTETYYVELFYSWGGVDFEKSRQYQFKEDHLDVSLEMPERVYPGQTLDATIKVTNQSGVPVKGVDLTAFAVSGKLNYRINNLPYYGPVSSSRRVKDYYSKKDLNDSKIVKLDLDHEKLEKAYRLDTMIYYRFTYPRKKQFKYTYDISDSTQFAVYVMQNGMADQVYVIEVDRVPVYYSWTNQPDEYSFYVTPCKKKEVTLRLYDRVVILDSLEFEEGKKTIISIDLDYLPRNVEVVNLEDFLTSTERNRHSRYVAEFNTSYYSYSFLESKTEFVPIHNRNNSSNVIIGPFKEGMLKYTKEGNDTTSYRHQGNYRYIFEDNIVYKLNSSSILPDQLRNSQFNPLTNINDTVLTKTRFLELQKEVPRKYYWHTRSVDMILPNTYMNILLPEEEAKSGLASMVLEECASMGNKFPCVNNYYNNQTLFRTSLIGYHNLIIVYNNGTFFKLDSIYLQEHTSVIIDFNDSELAPADSQSIKWKTLYHWEETDCYTSNSTKVYPISRYYFPKDKRYNVSGTIYSEQNSPLPGAEVLIKGTTYGTITDIEGRFSLNIEEYSDTLVVSYLGYISEEVEINMGSELILKLTEDIQSISQVVVIGYGTTKKSDITGSVSSIRSENMDKQAENMVEPEPVNEETEEESERQLYNELLGLKSIRRNFSDVGFWEPKLFTDKNGESKFTLTFPDDITRWDACVFAMNRRLQTGTERLSIKSYKPLMAELHVPNFLTRGDSAMFLGKVLNYSLDSIINGEVNWRGANSDFERNIRFTQYLTDSLPVKVTNTDSITTSYIFTRDDGYTDGEERTVPVVDQGVIRADGKLYFLQNGDQKHLKAGDNETITLEIISNPLDIYKGEVTSLINYKHACNEQLASKLIGLVNYKTIQKFEGEEFKFSEDVNTIIKRLLKNQNKEFLWSWWNVSGYTSSWMSSHILRALKYAKDAGYNVNLDIENLKRKATYQFDLKKNYSMRNIDYLHALADWGADLDYSKYTAQYDTIIWEQANNYGYSYLQEKLYLMEIRQKSGLPYSRDSLLKYKHENILGGVYFSDDKYQRYWYYNNLSSNVTAYNIIKNDSLLHPLKAPMQMYFLSSRKKGSWNTYQASKILMAVLPDLLADGTTHNNTANVVLSGKENKTISTFPYKLELKQGEEIFLYKESGLPLYCMDYTWERVTRAKKGGDGFEIATFFSNNKSYLEAGKPVNLIVEVLVKKDASKEHIMIDVPIPAACSYADKKQAYYGIETYREYYKEKTIIFCENMSAGKHTFEIRLLPRFTGEYILNPAQVSLVYFPVINSNNDMKKIEVKESTF